jgi:hypothetical protein
MRRPFNKFREFPEAMLVTLAVSAVLLFVIWQLATTRVSPESAELQRDLDFVSGELVTIKQRMLDFYRRLAGSGGAQSGLDVYRAEIVPTESAQVFRFILTLTQNIQRASMISGRVRIDIEGTLDNRPVKLRWAQISDGETPEPAYRFKYFQQLEGYLTLPDGFDPLRLSLTLESKNQRKPVIRNFDWTSLQGN